MSYDNASHNSQLPLIPGDDGWGDAAGDTGERLIKGQLFKFADWLWTIGKEREEVDVNCWRVLGEDARVFVGRI